MKLRLQEPYLALHPQLRARLARLGKASEHVAHAFCRFQTLEIYGWKGDLVFTGNNRMINDKKLKFNTNKGELKIYFQNNFILFLFVLFLGSVIVVVQGNVRSIGR